MSILARSWVVLGLAAPLVGIVLLTAPSVLAHLAPVRGRRVGHDSEPGRSADTTSSRSGLRRFEGRGRRIPDDTEVAQWCDRIARRLRTGDTLVAAVRTAPAPPGMVEVLRPVLLGLDRGADLRTAVRSTTCRTPAVDLAVTVLTATAQLGGPAAEPIDRAAAAIRRRVADEAERRTHSAQARASALTLTALPGVVLVLLAAASSTVRQQLAAPLGALCVGLGAVLNLAGWRWMRRIIEAAA